MEKANRFIDLLYNYYLLFITSIGLVFEILNIGTTNDIVVKITNTINNTINIFGLNIIGETLINKLEDINLLAISKAFCN